MASDVSALSSVVAKGHRVLPSFPPSPLIIPDSEFSPVRLEAPALSCGALPKPFPASFDAAPASLSDPAQRPGLSKRGGAHRPLARQGRVYYPRAYNRYYGLMRQSDELPPVWACSACSGRSLPSRAVRLTFPSLLVHTLRPCCDLYPVG